jgi:hypothetical protein
MTTGGFPVQPHLGAQLTLRARYLDQNSNPIESEKITATAAAA